VEHDPHSEVLAELVETVLRPCGHEQKVARLEWIPLALMKEDASPADDDVHLVLCVAGWLCRPLRRRREPHVEAPALQHADGVLAAGPRDGSLSFPETNDTTAF
jgi:hypothetical protein